MDFGVVDCIAALVLFWDIYDIVYFFRKRKTGNLSDYYERSYTVIFLFCSVIIAGLEAWKTISRLEQGASPVLMVIIYAVILIICVFECAIFFTAPKDSDKK